MVTTSQITQNGIETRENIGKCATHLFALHGFDATSIRDIAEAAGVTKPVLYYYYQSKENLFVTLIHEAYEFFYAAIDTILDESTDFMSRLKKVTNLYFDLGKEYGDTIRLIYMLAFGPRRNIPEVDIFEFEKKHFAYLGRLFIEGIEQGFVRKMEIESIIILYLGLISIYLQTLLFSNDPLPEKLDERILDLVFHGIGGEKK